MNMASSWVPQMSIPQESTAEELRQDADETSKGKRTSLASKAIEDALKDLNDENPEIREEVITSTTPKALESTPNHEDQATSQSPEQETPSAAHAPSPNVSDTIDVSREAVQISTQETPPSTPEASQNGSEMLAKREKTGSQPLQSPNVTPPDVAPKVTSPTPKAMQDGPAELNAQPETNTERLSPAAPEKLLPEKISSADLLKQLQSEAYILSVLNEPKVKKSKSKQKIAKKKGAVKQPKRKRKTSIAGNVSIAQEGLDYQWGTCVCGHNHPPIPSFEPTQGKCMYYHHISSFLPYITLSRVLETEKNFQEADIDKNGFIEKEELSAILKRSLGKDIPNFVIEKTFRHMDLDENGTLDFGEVITFVDILVQRKENVLPEAVNRGFSKICSIQ